MKLYRYMSLGELKKFQAGEVIQGQCAGVVCFMPENIECFDNPDYSRSKNIQMLNHMDFKESLGGIANPQLLAEFSIDDNKFQKMLENEDIKYKTMQYSALIDVDNEDRYMWVKELQAPEYSQDNFKLESALAVDEYYNPIPINDSKFLERMCSSNIIYTDSEKGYVVHNDRMGDHSMFDDPNIGLGIAINSYGSFVGGCESFGIKREGTPLTSDFLTFTGSNPFSYYISFSKNDGELMEGLRNIATPYRYSEDLINSVHYYASVRGEESLKEFIDKVYKYQLRTEVPQEIQEYLDCRIRAAKSEYTHELSYINAIRTQDVDYFQLSFGLWKAYDNDGHISYLDTGELIAKLKEEDKEIMVVDSSEVSKMDSIDFISKIVSEQKTLLSYKETLNYLENPSEYMANLKSSLAETFNCEPGNIRFLKMNFETIVSIDNKSNPGVEINIYNARIEVIKKDCDSAEDKISILTDNNKECKNEMIKVLINMNIEQGENLENFVNRCKQEVEDIRAIESLVDKSFENDKTEEKESEETLVQE